MRSALFILLFLATNAALALLYPFSLFAPRCWSRLFMRWARESCFFCSFIRAISGWLTTARRWKASAAWRLTFDDGPDPVDHAAPARPAAGKARESHFLCGRPARRQHPEIVRRAWEEGHLIGNHTWSHRRLFCFLTPRRLRAEIERGCGMLFEQCCGIPPALFPFAGGLAPSSAAHGAAPGGAGVHLLADSQLRYADPRSSNAGAPHPEPSYRPATSFSAARPPAGRRGRHVGGSAGAD